MNTPIHNLTSTGKVWLVYYVRIGEMLDLITRSLGYVS